MKDSLKNYIDKNREEFDLFTDDFDASWESISNNLDRDKQKQQFKMVWKVAAAVAFWIIVGVGALKFYYSTPASVKGSFAETPEYIETEQYYNRLIQEKIEIIQTKKGSIDTQVLENVAQLDKVYEELKQDLADQANNEEVIKAMIEHQRLKLSVLEQILENLEEDDHENVPHSL